MFGNVIVGIDGRDGGRDAIALGRLVLAPEGRVSLAHVRIGGVSRSISHGLLKEEKERASVEADLISIPGRSVAEGLHELADTHKVDLLVIGSCGRGRIGRVVAGDDTRAVLQGAPCAVAVAPRGYAAELKPLRRVGVGYDSSPESQVALDVARGLASDKAAELRALTVVSLPGWAYAAPTAVAYGDALSDLVAAAQRELDELGGVDGEALSGVAGERLAEFGDHVDLLIVGSRGFGPLRRVLLGSTSEYLARNAHCPLLVLPRLRDEVAVSSGT